MRKAIFQIAPLECPGCGIKIENSLLKENGVLSVKVFPGLGKVRAEFEETETNAEELETVINSLGYLVQFNKEG